MKFGNGNVASIEGNKLTIDFDRAGQKRVSWTASSNKA
jgi:DNA helicase-2/ATP-dependent DNA helicase PcrA